MQEAKKISSSKAPGGRSSSRSFLKSGTLAAPKGNGAAGHNQSRGLKKLSPCNRSFILFFRHYLTVQRDLVYKRSQVARFLSRVAHPFWRPYSYVKNARLCH